MNIDRIVLNGTDINTLHFLPLWRTLSAPAVKSSYEEIPAANGAIDTTEANGGIFYKMRDLEMGCKYYGNNWHEDFSKLMSDYHGRQIQIAFANDPGWYWTGRLSISSFDSQDRNLSMSATVFPFKFAEDLTVESASISGSGTMTLENHGRMTVVPELTTSAPIAITFDDKTVNVNAGTFTIAGLEIGYNETMEISITGTADVSFSYREATL